MWTLIHINVVRNWTALTLYTQRHSTGTYYSCLFSTKPPYTYCEHAAASESINIQLCCKNKCNMHGAFIFGLVWDLGCGVWSVFLLLFYSMDQNSEQCAAYAGGLERSAIHNARPIAMPNPFETSHHCCLSDSTAPFPIKFHQKQIYI